MNDLAVDARVAHPFFSTTHVASMEGNVLVRGIRSKHSLDTELGVRLRTSTYSAGSARLVVEHRRSSVQGTGGWVRSVTIGRVDQRGALRGLSVFLARWARKGPSVGLRPWRFGVAPAGSVPQVG